MPGTPLAGHGSATACMQCCSFQTGVRDDRVRLVASDLFINRGDVCDYDGVQVDGRIINLAFPEDRAARGNETSRAAFEGAFLAYTRLPGLESLLKRIPVYPDAGHDGHGGLVKAAASI